MSVSDRLIRNSLEQIDLMNSAGFKQIFSDLTNQNKGAVAAKLASQLLEQQEPLLLKPIPDRERYEFIVKNLKELYPYLKTYFSRDDQLLNVPGDGINFTAISTRGQRILIESMKHKFHGKEIKVCDNFSKFSNQISSFCRDPNSSDMTFLVRHRDKPNSTARHMSAVHIQKKNDNTFRVYISDSLGNMSCNPASNNNLGKHTLNVLNAIRNGYAASESENEIEINYYSGAGRQVDRSNCVVVAIKDAIEMVRNTKKLYEWIDQNRVSNNDNTFAVPYLPIRMVKTVQSLSYIDKYLSETNQQNVQIPSYKKSKDKTLLDSLQKHTFIGTDARTGERKRLSGKTAHIYLKFEKQLIAQYLANCLTP